MDFKEYMKALNENDTLYLAELLKQFHDEFDTVYGMDVVENEFEWVSVPAVIKARDSGKLTLGLVNLDLTKSGTRWIQACIHGFIITYSDA